MCVYSMIVDHKMREWQDQPLPIFPAPAIPQHEIDEFRRLLERAREYDRKMNQPDCDLEEKKAAIRAVAEKLGVDVSFV